MARPRGRLNVALPLVAALLAVAAEADPPAWQVENGSGGELWLLGSVHYLRDRDYPLPAVVDELYARADAIVMELDLDDLASVEAQSAFLDTALLPAGVTLRDRLTPALYGLAQQRGRELGVELQLLDRFEPWLVAVTLLERGMAQRGFQAERGIETYLLGKAMSDRKEVLGLESVATQAAVFGGLSEAEQQALLEQTLQELESPTIAIDDLIDAWRNGQLDALADRLSAEFDEFPTLYEALVVARNNAWIDPLTGYLESPDRHLVVVGALHLVGEHNVLDLLRARGLTVEPIAPD